MKQFYKVARPDGFDFCTNTINYRINIGKTVSNPKKTESKELCTADVIHASEFFFDALSYGDLPCSIFLVEGIPVSKQSDKAGFKELKIVKEIPTANWQNAFHSLVIWMLEDLKNNFDCKKEKNVTGAVNQAIQVFVNAQKTGKIDVFAALSAALSAAEAAAEATRFATLSAEYSGYTTLSVEYARFALSAEAAALSARFALVVGATARSARFAALSVNYAARSVGFAAKSVEFARSAGFAAKSVEFARSAGSAALYAKKKELSDKFIGLLEGESQKYSTQRGKCDQLIGEIKKYGGEQMCNKKMKPIQNNPVTINVRIDKTQNPDYLIFQIENMEKKISFDRYNELNMSIDFDSELIGIGRQYNSQISHKLIYPDNTKKTNVNEQYKIIFVKDLNHGGYDGEVVLEFQQQKNGSLSGKMQFYDIYQTNQLVVDFEKKQIKFLNATFEANAL